MTALESGWAYGGGGPVHVDPANQFGAAPVNTWSNNSGPYFPGGGNQLGAKPSRDAAFAPFFGIPSKEDTPDPYEAYDIENYQLPDGFKGSRPYLKYIILKQVTQAEQFPFREMAPFVRNDNSQEITWDVWMFNNHMLGRTPEESVSRLLTMNMTQSRESMVRFGIALMLEHGFFQTPKGKENYRRNLDQISAAIATTLAYGAMYACLNTKYTDPYNKYRKHQSRNLLQMSQLFREEIDNWAIIQKSEDGWKIITEKCRNVIQQRIGKPGDYTVVPAGMEKYLAARPENKYYLYNGINGGRRTNLMPIEGTLRESVGYRVGEHQPNDDPTIRERTIGGFFHMLAHHVEDVPESEYNSSMMNTEIYSEDKDDYHTVRYSDAISRLGLFHTDDDKWPLSSIGSEFFGSIGSFPTWGVYLERAGVMKKVKKKISKMGHECVRTFLGCFDLTAPTTPLVPAKTNQGKGNGGKKSQLSGLNENVEKQQEKLNTNNALLQGVLALGNANAQAEGVLNLFSFLDSYQLDAESSQMIGSYATYISEVNEDLLYPLQKVIGDMAPNHELLEKADIVSVYAQMMAPYVTLWEQKEALKQLSDEHSPMSNLEALLVQSDVVDARKRHEADTLSPQWLSLPGEMQTPTHALVITGLIDFKPFDLSERSTFFTLASHNLVLVRVSTGEITHHIETIAATGAIAVNKQEMMRVDPVRTKKLLVDGLSRFNMLQFNITVSVVFHLMLEAFRKHHLHAKANERLDVKTLAETIAKAIPRLDPINYDSHSYSRDVDTLAANLKPLHAQRPLHALMDATRSVVLAAPSSTMKQIKSLLESVYLLFLRQILQGGATIQPDRSMLIAGESFIGISLFSDVVAKAKTAWEKKKQFSSKKELDAAFKEVSNEALERMKKIASVSSSRSGYEADFLNEHGKNLVDLFKAAILKEDADEVRAIEDAVKILMLLYLPEANLNKAITPSEYVICGLHELLGSKNKLVREKARNMEISQLKAYLSEILPVLDTAVMTRKNDKKQLLVADLKPLISTVQQKLANTAANIQKALSAPLGAPVTSTNLIEQFILTEDEVEEILNKADITDGRLVKFALEYHLPPLFGILGFRPHKRYMMGTMIHMRGGGEAAKTYYGHADFQLSDNVAQKMHYGHYTMYAKTIVLRPEMVVRGDNIVVKDYNGGNGHRIWDPLDDDHKDAYRSNELECDIFLAAVLPYHRIETQFMDITGRFSDRLMPNDEARMATAYPPMDRILSQTWGWRAVASPLNREHFSNLAPKFNTLVFQEHQMLYNHGTKKYDRVIIDRGHWGTKVYPGCGEVRRGYSMYFKSVDYDHTRQIVIGAS